jgi:uncharacterized membrane protein
LIDSETVPAVGSPTRRQLTVVAAIIIGYAALSYYSDSRPDAPNLAAGLSLAPVVLIGLVLAWRWTRPVIAILIGALTCAMLYRYWPFIRSNYPWSNLAQQIGAYGFLALGFARSLAAGLVPLCTQLAERVHGPLMLLTLAIAALFFTASARTWSLFVNFGTFGLIGLMFFVEHAIRLKVLPHRPRAGMLVALRQFLIG